METNRPLTSFPIIATNRVEEAECCLSQSITDVRIDQVEDRNNFRLELSAVNFGHCSLLYNSFGTQTQLTTGMDIDCAIFVAGMGIPITLFIDNKTHLVTKNRAAIIASAKKVRVERPAQSEILYLRASLSDLWNHFGKLTGRHHRGSLIFDSTASIVKGPGVMLKGFMDYLVDVLTFNDSVVSNPAIRKSFDDSLMTAMLSLPHNKLDQLYEDQSGMVAPAIVCRAEEYMRAHLKQPVTISDLLRICECSRSVLFSAFRSSRDYTPLEFLTEQRLYRARDQLLKANYNASISSIAFDCGFISPSWFSQIYRKRFGERPSDTLRKGK